jgi:hypothetical protein
MWNVDIAWNWFLQMSEKIKVTQAGVSGDENLNLTRICFDLEFSLMGTVCISSSCSISSALVHRGDTRFHLQPPVGWISIEPSSPVITLGWIYVEPLMCRS